MSGNFQKQWVGVFGDPVDDNPTVVLQQAGFDHAGLPFAYLTIQVKKGDLKRAIEGMKAMNFAGINLTMPHKIEVLDYLDGVSEDARLMGAVNTVYAREGKLYGENTDGKGFILNLQKQGVAISGRKAVILGAGGAARAIGVELAKHGAAEILIVNVNRERGESLARLLDEKTGARAQFIPWEGTYALPADADILVNATPLGFIDENEKPDIDYARLKPELTVCDVIPNREVTPFLKEAADRGCKVLNGLQMLAYQGAIAFEVWTGHKAPTEVMIEALRKYYAG